LTEPGAKRVPIDRRLLLLLLAVESLVDLADLLDPEASVGVLQGQDLLQRPVEMVGEVGYLLVELIERVAYDPPVAPGSTSNSLPHSGHLTLIADEPVSLIRR